MAEKEPIVITPEKELEVGNPSDDIHQTVRGIEKQAEPIVGTEPRKLESPTFNKKEIEGIAKGVCFARFDIDEPPQDLVQYDSNVDDIDDAIEKGVIPNTGIYKDLTDAQIAGLRKILKKAIYDGIVYYSGDYNFINYVGVTSNEIAACFGCISTSGTSHQYLGMHLEIDLDIGSKTLNVAFSEV